MLSNASIRPNAGQRLIDNDLGGRGLGEVDVDDQRLGAGGLHRLRRLVQMRAVPRHEDERGEVAREADGRRPADALARAGDDRD